MPFFFYRSQEPAVPKDDIERNNAEGVVLEEKDEELHNEKVMSRLVMLQFSIDQMALEVIF